MGPVDWCRRHDRHRHRRDFAIRRLVCRALADRFGRVRMLQIAILWYSVFTFLCSLARNFEQLFILRGLHGLGFGGEWGVCGCCTILVDGEAAHSCIMLAVQAEGARFQTIEGLAKDGALHPLQPAFHEHHGLQCGFCTPGMLMVALGFLRLNPNPSEAEIREPLSAVLCRCTGYRDIVRAVAAAAAMMRNGEEPR
jgi:aerobic carbon-monoxide dehydrogenase small subunit